MITTTEIQNIIKFDYGTIELTEDDIIIYRPSKNLATYTMPHAMELNKQMLKICNTIPKPCILNNSHFTESPSKEVKQFTHNNLGNFASICAVIENSSLTRYLVNTFIYLYRPEVPIKMFKTEDEAINWLKQNN